MAVASGGVAEAEGGRVVGVSLGSLSGVGQIETIAHVMCSTKLIREQVGSELNEMPNPLKAENFTYYSSHINIFFL